MNKEMLGKRIKLEGREEKNKKVNNHKKWKRNEFISIAHNESSFSS